MNFRSLYSHGFARVAACTTRTHLADPQRNAEAVLAMARECDAQGVALAVFPELTLSGYSIEDLLLQDALLDAVEQAIGTVLAGSKQLTPILVIGAPLRHAGRVYNTALVIHRGRRSA
jgi:NAD+ synthase (glutamine-hydrolysing)